MMIKKTRLTVFIFIFLSFLPKAFAECEQNVDKVKLLYINGMFTDYKSYIANMSAVENLVDKYLFGMGFDPTVEGAHNRNENVISQVIEVARQKFEDLDASSQLAIKQFINNDSEFLNDPEAVETVKDYLNDIKSSYSGTLAEQDTEKAREKLVELLDTCSRVIMVTHSQGNFYGNALINDIYYGYEFPNGYKLAQYPMLGNMQIASPVSDPGGAVGSVYPDTVGHLTNDNDLYMGAVRATLGSTSPNFDADFNPQDVAGHGLEASYLSQPEQGAEIASQISQIAGSFIPYPLHNQWYASSSALEGFGFTKTNELLDVEFGDGSVYRYSDVNQNVFLGLSSAESQGQFFNERIRGSYDYQKIE